MRLFVAMELGQPVRESLGNLQTQLRRGCDGVRWTAREQLHVTVRFLGEVSDPDVDSVAAAVDRAAKAGSPFRMSVTGAGCFPDRGPVRIVWAGVEEESGALLRCVERVHAELEELGYPKERRPFSPHITIGRVRGDRSTAGIRGTVASTAFEPIDQRIEDMTLMSSILLPQGSTYAAVRRARLGLNEQQNERGQQNESHHE